MPRAQTTDRAAGSEAEPGTVTSAALPPLAAELLRLQQSAGNRAVGALLARRRADATPRPPTARPTSGFRFRMARCPGCGGTCAPRRPAGPEEELELLPAELSRVIARSPAAGPRRLARCKCAHDGRRGCGMISGKFGVEDSDTGVPGVVTIDHRVVTAGLAGADPGTWATQVRTPPNPVKEGAARGWVDGMKVDIGSELVAQVVEVKSRRGGGCCQASREAVGYVDVLNGIAPEIRRISELATANGTGLRAPAGASTAELGALVRPAGIDLGPPKMALAWAFYNSLQNRLDTTFSHAFSAVRFRVHDGAEPDVRYPAGPPVLILCRDRNGTFFGIEQLVFQVNGKGGVSYGCEAICSRKRQRSAEEQAAIAAYERRQAEGGKDAPKAEVVEVTEGEGDAVAEPEPQRPAVITALLPELQAREIAGPLQAGLAEKLGRRTAGQGFALLASEQFVTEFVGKPRAQRTAELLKTRVPPALRFRSINAQMLFWFYGVPMAIAIVVAVTRGAGAGPMTGAAGQMTAGIGGAGGASLATLGRLAGAAANDNAIKIAAQAAAVVLVLAVARTASADGDDHKLQEVHGILAVPSAELPGSPAVGDTVEHGGFRRVVVGTAHVL